jgi:hypothetical protein
MATLARFQATATDDAGNILASPSVEVRLESTNAIIQLYSDRAGTVTIGNPFTGQLDGSFAFHVPGGAYKITVTLGAVQRILRYVAIGTNAELDNIYDGAINNLNPATNGGASLGSPTNQWTNLFLFSGGTINFNASDVVITHSANALAFTGGNYSFSGNLTVSAGAFSGRIDPRLQSTASGDVSPDISATDYYVRTALAAACAINAPTGTPAGGNKLMFRFKDNGTVRALNWNAIYRAIGVVIPTATVANKNIYVAAIYNIAETKWDVVAVNVEG